MLLWLALVLVFPVLTRAVLLTRFWRLAPDYLKPAELDRESHRGYILTLAGFSFTGLLGLAVLDQATQQNLELATLFLVVSFGSFMFALDVQSYKARRWQDDLATAAVDVARLGMLLSVLAVLFAGPRSRSLKLAAWIVVIVWLVDHVTRFRLEWRYRRELRCQNGMTTNEARER